MSQKQASFALRIILTLLYTFLAFTITNSAFSNELNAFRTEAKPEINGILSPAEWPVDDSASGFIQMEPFKGRNATEKTIVRFMYDSEALYFSFFCLDNDKERITAGLPMICG